MADVSISLPEELTRGSVETACLDANPQAMYDCAAVRHADGAGLAFLWLLRGQKRLTGTLSAELAKSLEAFDAAQAALPKVTPPPKEPPLVALGRAECDLFARWGEAIAYLGETLCAFGTLFRGHFRWGDCGLAFFRCGVQAVPVMMLIGFLLGLILAFQSAIPIGHSPPTLWCRKFRRRLSRYRPGTRIRCPRRGHPHGRSHRFRLRRRARRHEGQ